MLCWYAFLEIVVSISRFRCDVVVLEVSIRRLSGYVLRIIGSVSTVLLKYEDHSQYFTPNAWNVTISPDVH